MNERQLSYRALFAVVYTTSVASVYFALGVITHRAEGLTPLVLLAAGLFFQLTAMTYAEGASLHRERGGSSVFARHAFNELVSFLAGWSIVLDYTILIAVTALVVPYYLTAFWGPLGHGGARLAITLGVIAFVALDNLTGVSARRMRRRVLVTVLDLLVQALIIVLGLALVFHPERLSAAVHLGSAPTVSNLLFALPVAVIAFTGLEAAANLSGEIAKAPHHARRLVTYGSGLIVLVYVGIAVVGVGGLPVHHGVSALGHAHIRAPLLGVVSGLRPHALAVVMKYVVGISGVAGLTAGAGSAMLGVSRTGYSLATNRQIPSGVGRLSGRWGTPWLVIAGAAIAAAALTLPDNVDFLVGIYAFGALVAFTIAHLSVIVLRYREADEPRRYAVPLSIPAGGASLPLPSVLGAILSVVGLGLIVVLHAPARYVGLGWTLGGTALYVTYRVSQGKPLLRRITIPELALRHERRKPTFGSILVPVFGTALDDDIIQTASRLAGERHDDIEEEGAVIEAIWVFEMPLSLPVDAPLPERRLAMAREALARAKLVGEEHGGIQVATATVRARRAGQAIVEQARRRGVEAIVLAAEEPSRTRGGPRLGARGPLDDHIGEITKHVIRKAPCRVILTAPPANWRERSPGAPAADGSPPSPGVVPPGPAARDGAGGGQRMRQAAERPPEQADRPRRQVTFVELEYRSALVPIFGTDLDATSLRTAARLVGEGALVEALYVLRVPNQLPLEGGLAEEEQIGRSVLEGAQLAGRRAGVKVQTRLIRARNPGSTIVEEAQRTGAEIIYLGTAHAPPSERALGPTARYLLAHRPCRVVIETSPADGARSSATELSREFAARQTR